MTAPVRVRFAPSPTGMFHVGGARSALFNWIFAKQRGGRFVLRIEDTDAARNKPEWTEGILTALAWIGIDATDPAFEGPYLQSDHAEQHRAAAGKLLADDRAYYCGCTRDQVIERSGNPHAGYDGHCRDLDLGPGEGRALRFKVPRSGDTVVVDLIRGEPRFANADLEDFVIARADGSATFLIANVVDDITMGITHVIRGEEHLPNAPKQQLLWQALGVTPPIWAHVPVLVNQQRKKLSKRRDRVALESYRDEGYLSTAMVNYLMLLGWAPTGDREILPFETISAEFDLGKVTLSPAYFDLDKLRAFNGEYIRALSVPEFIDACQPWLRGETPWPAEAYDPALFAAVAELAHTRVAVLADIVALVDFLFLDAPVHDEASWAKAMKGDAASILAAAADAFDTVEWRADALKDTVERIGAAHGIKLGKAQAPIRVAVTGRTVGLPLFESLEQLGRARSVDRVRQAAARLG